MTTAPTTPQAAPASAAGQGSSAANPLALVFERLATTPGKMQAFAIAIAVFSFFLWYVVSGILQAEHQAVQTIGKDTVPSIVAAENIRAYLADMDANAANGYFSHGTAAAKKQYEEDRLKVTDALIAAARNITYEKDELPPVRTMTDSLQQYVGLVEIARTKGYPAGLPILVQASAVMHETLLPAAVNLDAANFVYLNQTYEKTRRHAIGMRIMVLALGGVLLILLLATQVYLFRKTRRLLNSPLIVATLLTVVFMLQMLSMISQEDALLKRAKQDCFDSIHALWMARAVAYDANGDESMYLLWHDQRARYTAQFQEKSALLADTPLNETVVSAAETQLPHWKGYIGDELRNITFEGEKAAALDMLQTYTAYQDVDTNIRNLEEDHRHEEAVTLCTGTQPGQSNYAFAQFDAALGKVLDINQKEFDKTVEDAFTVLRLLPFVAPVFALLIAALAGFGLHLRIREYAG